MCEFFDWNISYLTFYDHLREYLSMGLVDADDLVLQSSLLENNSQIKEENPETESSTDDSENCQAGAKKYSDLTQGQ